jgi:hypothetical protein
VASANVNILLANSSVECLTAREWLSTPYNRQNLTEAGSLRVLTQVAIREDSSKSL